MFDIYIHCQIKQEGNKATVSMRVFITFEYSRKAINFTTKDVLADFAKFLNLEILKGMKF